MKDNRNKDKKKVLMIAYSFPPMGGGRVRRSLKFAKYLPEFGWEPVVLTVKKPYAAEYDYGLLKELKGRVKVVRTPSLEPSLLTNYLKRLRPKLLKTPGFMDRLKSALYRFVNKLKWCIFFPDSRIGWVPFCVLYGWRLIKKEKISLIYVSGEPFSCFISGLLLKKITGVPLVLDYRDEWIGFSKYYFSEKLAIIEKIEGALEKIIVKNADKVISVTKPIVNSFINRYKNEEKEKFLCITNGFDPDDFKDLSCGYIKNDKFTVCYTGILYKRRSPEYFLTAVKRIIKKEPEFLRSSKIRFIGKNSDEIIDFLKDESELRDIIEIVGFLPHKETLEEMVRSDLLLYIEDQAPDSNRVLPAKLFEYIGSGRPIMALSNGGPVQEVMQYAACGRVAASTDVERIADCLVYFYKVFKENKKITGGAGGEKTMQFSRRNLTGRLAEVFVKTYG